MNTCEVNGKKYFRVETEIGGGCAGCAGNKPIPERLDTICGMLGDCCTFCTESDSWIDYIWKEEC